MDNLIIFILIFIGGAIFGRILHAVRSAIKKAEEVEKKAEELEEIRVKMENVLRNQSDYTIQVVEALFAGDAITLNIASGLADEESEKFNSLLEKFNEVYHRK